VSPNPCKIEYSRNYTVTIAQRLSLIKEIYRVVPHHIRKYSQFTLFQGFPGRTGCSEVQIVKFHGSLEVDESLVLTESDYYKRLEFVTPIDIKLRADSLGKSLLFIGYSFSNFNIRYLWFKLRRMIYEVDPRDNPDSYILLFDPDHVTSVLLKKHGYKHHRPGPV